MKGRELGSKEGGKSTEGRRREIPKGGWGQGET